MFLPWIGQLGFFPSNPETGIFLGYPKNIRRDLASQVVSHLLQDEKAFTTLTSKQHVTVTLELLGQSFGLDISEDKLISQVTELYKKWLLTDSKPTPMREDVEFYIVEMLKHFSLLFTPRDQGNVQVHAKLCSAVFDVLDQLGKDYATLLSVPTWESILRIVLGICDHLFRLPEAESALATALCGHLFRVTMALWVRSTTQSAEMWDIFKSLLHHWRHRKPIIAQWVSTCTSFTHSILSLLYVFPSPKTTVVFQHLNISDTVQLEQGLVFFYWFRLLHLLGDLDSIESPQIYLEAMQGLHHLCKLFYLNMDIKNPKLLPPDANGILHIFAPFLLDSVNVNRPGYDEGRAEALHILLQICTQKPSQSLHPTYLAALYRGIQQGVAHSNLFLDIVLRGSDPLFTNNFKGIRLLVPTFWWALKLALVEPGLDKMEKLVTLKPQLRLHCYRLASYLLAYANLYKGKTFGEVCPNTELFGASADTNFSELLSLRSVLISCLHTDKSDHNLTLLINVIFNSLWEDPTSVPDLAMQLVETTLGTNARKYWSSEVMAAVLQSWTDLAQLSATIFPLNPSLGDELITRLAELLDDLFRQKSEPTATQDLIILAYRCISTWIMKDQWILASQSDLPRNNTSLFKVYSYVFLGLTGRWGVAPGMAPHDPVSNPPLFLPSEDVQQAARSILLLLLNRIDNFPAIFDSSIMSSPKSEFDVISSSSVCEAAVGVYILDDRIVTVVRHPRDQEGNFITTLFVRDATGRYCWNTTLLFDPLPPQKLHAAANPGLLVPPPQPEHEVLDPVLRQSLLGLLSEDETSRHERLLPLLNQLVEQEQQKLGAQAFHLDKPSALAAPKPPAIAPEHDTTAARLLLTHLGWNDPNYRSRVFFVKDVTTTANPAEELRVLFSEIDSLRERWQYSVAVFFVKGPYPTDNSIFSNSTPSNAFNDFVKALGEEITLTKHHGFVGGLHPEVTGANAMYYANHETELIFHVAPNMPYASLTAQQYKRRLLLEDKVAIVWVENTADFKGFNFVKDSLAHTLIVLMPLSEQLIRVQLYERPDDSLNAAQAGSICAPNGPLMDEIILTKNSLAPLVRIATLNVLTAHAHSERPFVSRQKAINDFIKKHKNDKATPQLYYCQQFA